MINAARRNSKYLLSGNSDFNGVRIDAHLYKNDGSKNPEVLEERSVYAYIAEDGTIQSEKTDIDSVRGDVIRDIRLTKKFNDGMVIGSFLMIVILLVGMFVTLFLKEFLLLHFQLLKLDYIFHFQNHHLHLYVLNLIIYKSHLLHLNLNQHK